MVTAPLRRGVVRAMVMRGLSERIVALAHRHRRYGAGMIYLKLRQEGRVVNHTRVDRLYAEARLQVKRRRRKKVPIADHQPLPSPSLAHPEETLRSHVAFALRRYQRAPSSAANAPMFHRRVWRKTPQRL